MSDGATSSLHILRRYAGNDPVAAAEVAAATVPTGKQWKIRCVSVSLAQGATQTPLPILQIDAGATAVDEIQTLDLDATPAGGSVKIRFTPPDDHQPHGAGPFDTAVISGVANITAAEIQAALRLIAGLEELTCTGADGGQFTITFTTGDYYGHDIPALQVTANTITPATAFTFTEDTKGVIGGVIYESAGSTTVQAVNTTTRYNWAPGLVTSGQIGATTNVHSFAPLPEHLVLPSGYRILTSTIGIGANSNYAGFSVYVVEFG